MPARAHWDSFVDARWDLISVGKFCKPEAYCFNEFHGGLVEGSMRRRTVTRQAHVVSALITGHEFRHLNPHA